MIGALLMFVIYCLILGLIVWLVLFAVSQIPMAPPFPQIIRAVVIVVAVIIVIVLLWDLAGTAGVGRGPLLR